MNKIKIILKYSPYISLFIALAYSFWFFNSTLPTAGRGSDAAGSGMTKGFSLIIYLLGLGVYLSLSAVSFRFQFNNRSTPGILIFLLWLPVFIFIFIFFIRQTEQIIQRQSERESYSTWFARAHTMSYQSVSTGISFQYASEVKGTFNLSYFAPLKTIEFEQGVNLVVQSDDGARLLGQLQILKKSKSNSPLEFLQQRFEKSDCEFSKGDNSLLKQFSSPRYQIFVNKTYSNCADHIQQTLPSISEYNGRIIEVFFVADIEKQDRILQIVIGDVSNTLSGPLEKNKTSKELVDWYQTVSF